MNNGKNLFIAILLICLTFPLSAQKGTIGQQCPPSYDRAKRKVETFLTWDYLSEKRNLSGTQGIPTSQIRPVESTSVCTELMAIVNNNQNYQNIQSNLSADKTNYFYRTNEFYFIFWEEKPVEVPQGSVRIKTGPRTLFIVVSQDYQTVWEFYI